MRLFIILIDFTHWLMGSVVFELGPASGLQLAAMKWDTVCKVFVFATDRLG